MTIKSFFVFSDGSSRELDPGETFEFHPDMVFVKAESEEDALREVIVASWEHGAHGKGDDHDRGS